MLIGLSWIKFLCNTKKKNIKIWLRFSLVFFCNKKKISDWIYLISFFFSVAAALLIFLQLNTLLELNSYVTRKKIWIETKQKNYNSIWSIVVAFFSVIRAKRTLRIKEKKKNYLAKLNSLANVFCFTFFLVCLCVLLVFSSFSEKIFFAINFTIASGSS